MLRVGGVLPIGTEGSHCSNVFSRILNHVTRVLKVGANGLIMRISKIILREQLTKR